MLVPWLATTAPCRPPLSVGIRALYSTSFRGKQHGVGTGGERGTERKGERKGTADGTGNGQGTAKGEADRCEEASRERKGKINRLWGTRRSNGSSTGGKCRLDSALTISGTGATEDCSRHSGEWPRPTWT